MSSLKDDYLSVKASLGGTRPTRVRMYEKLGEGFRKYLKDGWITFLASIGELTKDEMDWPGSVAEEFLFELENTVFQKAYKIPVILAFLDDNGIRSSVGLREIGNKMMEFYYREEVLQQDFCDEGNRDWRHWDAERFARLALEDPIYYLARKERFFHYDEVKQSFYLDESLQLYLSKALAGHVRDIMEYRRLRYIKKRYGEESYGMAETAAGQAAESPHAIVYNKLVRDRIPEIIRGQGKRCETRILDDAEFLKELDRKLQEEMKEYLESGSGGSRFGAGEGERVADRGV